MNIQREHLWLMKLARNRLIIDSLLWLLLAFLVLSFCFLHAVVESYQTEQPLSAILGGLNDWGSMLENAIIKTLIFTGGMMVPVYINLLVLKEFILDAKAFGPKKYILYLICVVVLAVVFSYSIDLLHRNNILNDIHIIEANLATIGSIAFLVILISTGLLYLREALIYRYLLDLKERKLAKNNITITQLQEAVSRLEEDHMKVGTEKNYSLIRYDEILYFEGDGNQPVIHTTDGRRIGGTRKLMDYEKELPDLFVRVHKSYIISIKHISKRKSNTRKRTAYFILRDCKTPIPIGATYHENIENNPYLQWNKSDSPPQRELRVVSYGHPRGENSSKSLR